MSNSVPRLFSVLVRRKVMVKSGGGIWYHASREASPQRQAEISSSKDAGETCSSRGYRYRYVLLCGFPSSLLPSHNSFLVIHLRGQA